MSPCFETILVINGVPQHVEYHVRRMMNTLLDCECVTGEIANMITEAISSACGGSATERCRVEYDGSGILGVFCQPYVRTLPQVVVLIDGSGTLYSHKWCDRRALDALRSRAVQHGGDEALIIQHGKVTDTTIANVAFWDGARWLTPDEPLLCGTTRQRLLESGRITAAPIRVGDLSQFSAVALMNALVGFCPLDDATWQRLQMVKTENLCQRL